MLQLIIGTDKITTNVSFLHFGQLLLTAFRMYRSGVLFKVNWTKGVHRRDKLFSITSYSSITKWYR